MKYFTIAELTRTNQKANNAITIEQGDNLKHLVEKVLDPAREEFGFGSRLTHSSHAPMKVDFHLQTHK